MAIIKGLLAGVVAFVVLILLASTMGMLGPVEQFICAVPAAVVGVFVGRRQRSARNQDQSSRS